MTNFIPSTCAFPNLAHTTGYQYGCRCDKCKDANAVSRSKAQKPEPWKPGDPCRWDKSITRVSAYTNRKCRCDDCKASNAALQRVRRKERKEYAREHNANTRTPESSN